MNSHSLVVVLLFFALFLLFVLKSKWKGLSKVKTMIKPCVVWSVLYFVTWCMLSSVCVVLRVLSTCSVFGVLFIFFVCLVWFGWNLKLDSEEHSLMQHDLLTFHLAAIWFVSWIKSKILKIQLDGYGLLVYNDQALKFFTETTEEGEVGKG